MTRKLMPETIWLDDIAVSVTRKKIKRLYLSVHPPHGHVTLVAPAGMRPETARAFAASKLRWIRRHQEKIRGQQRATPRQYVPGEYHLVWGEPHPLDVVECDAKPFVTLGQRGITLTVRPGSSRARREAVMRAWYESLLHESVPSLIRKWEQRLGVTVTAYSLRHMRTRWGSCSYRAARIRLNTELARKPIELLEYVVVHELLHLIVPSHGKRFVALIDTHYPGWREARAKLNAVPPI